MATYYRWRRSYAYGERTTSYSHPNTAALSWLNYSYKTAVSASIDQSTGKFTFSGESGPQILSTDISDASGIFFGMDSYGNWDYSQYYELSNCGLQRSGNSTAIIIAFGTGTLHKIRGIGDFIDYVYSTSSSAYPNGGVQDGYYYDQRTTVTSPTAPTGLTCPNPITTPTVTVSWNAATSNVPDYPVDHYSLSYNTDPNWSGMPTPAASNIKGTSFEFDIPPGATQIKFWVYSYDTNGQPSGNVQSEWIPVYLAPTLTVPQMVMQGQSATISWSAISGADSYTLQRKSNTDTDWTQVYSGANLSYSEMVGTWTSVQYRVQAVFSGTPGGWATSDPIQIVSASALVISGQDGDLGTLTSDVPYSISSDQTSPIIDVTVEVNGGEYAAFQATSGQTYTIGVLDLPTGTGSIVITATTTVSESPVTVTRTWTYSKTAQTFPNSGSVATLTKEGNVVYPETLVEAVRAAMTPWGGNLSTALNLLKNAALFNRTKTPKYSEVTISMANVTEGQIVNIPRGGVMTPHYVAKLEYESGLNGAGRRLLVPVKVYDQRQWNSTNVNAYAKSAIDAWMNSTYKALFPEDIQTAMGTTKFYYTPGNGNWTVGTLERSIFALSVTELGQSHTYANVEGSALPIASTLRIAYQGGSATNQWTRSPYMNVTDLAWGQNSSGSIGGYFCSNSHGSRPAFTLPSTFTGTYFVDQGGGIHDSQEYEEAGTWSDVWGNEIPAVKIATGSYVGTGTHGQDNPTFVTLPFSAKCFMVQERKAEGDDDAFYRVIIIDAGVTMVENSRGGAFSINVSEFSETVSWWMSPGSTGNAVNQLNESGTTYDFVAIG